MNPPGEPLDSFAALVLRQLGVNPAIYRAQPLRRRLSACLRHLRAPSMEAAENLLRRRPQLLSSTLDTLLIGVSAFFRDPAVFEHLRAMVLPELLRNRAGINAYAAGVSSGHELYSLAMLLDERSALEQSRLLGLDCRPGAIFNARTGIFGPEELTSLGVEQLEKYFPSEGGERRASPRLRSRIEWRCDDMMVYEPAARQQLILFRNVAIYLEPEAALRAWNNLDRILEPGGFLVTGKAEQPPPALALSRVGQCIYRKS